MLVWAGLASLLGQAEGAGGAQNMGFWPYLANKNGGFKVEPSVLSGDINDQSSDDVYIYM